MQTFKNNRILAKWVGTVQGSSFANLRNCLPSILSVLIVQIIVAPLTALSVSLPPGHPCDILGMLFMCCCCWILSSEAYLFSLQLGSILCLLVLVFSFLSVLLPDFPFPAFVLCQQTRGACGLPLWEPCVGKCHCFRQRRAWPHPDSRRSSDRHPLHMVPGPLRASVYCTLLKHRLVWQQVSNSLLICILGIKVKSGHWGEWPRVCSPTGARGARTPPWDAVGKQCCSWSLLGPPRSHCGARSSVDSASVTAR